MSVPHQYPLAKSDVGVFGGISLNFATMPFPVTRLVLGLALGAASAAIFTTWLALVVVGYVYVHKIVGGVLMVAGALGLVFLWMPWARRKSFLDQCAHTLVLSRLITHGDTGTPTFVADSRVFVKGALGDVEQLDDTINAISARIRSMLRRIDGLASDIPGIGKALAWLTRMMMPFVSSIVIAYVLIRNDGKGQETADDAIVYVAQNSKEIVGACLRAVFSEKLLGSVVFLLFFAIFGGLVWVIAGAITPDLLTTVSAEHRELAITSANVAALVLLGGPLSWIAYWIVREAFIRPALVAFVLARFLSIVQQQPIDENWRQRLRDAEELGRSGRVRVPI
jgi:hypothetical protein